MNENKKYLPGERNLYEQLSLEERQEWDSLNREEKKFYLGIETSAVGEKVLNEINSLNEKIKYNSRIMETNSQKMRGISKRLSDSSKGIKDINKKINIFGF